jgi:hypothetical protein
MFPEGIGTDPGGKSNMPTQCRHSSGHIGGCSPGFSQEMFSIRQYPSLIRADHIDQCFSYAQYTHTLLLDYE